MKFHFGNGSMQCLCLGRKDVKCINISTGNDHLMKCLVVVIHAVNSQTFTDIYDVQYCCTMRS